MALETEWDSKSDVATPVNVEFRSLTFKVVSRNEDGGFYTILDRLNGICKNGRLLALMGPSGAGKTTLLDILAGNVFGGRVEGEIRVNGRRCAPSAMASLSCYVMQHPVLLSSATVKESLMTSALLRLSKSITKREKEQLVAEIIEELGLGDCMNVLVGSELEGIKGISGGQMRSLAVGIELVTRPRVIVLDEPTSGLDSEIALTIMQTLKSLAHNRRTVVCSIHQPNSEIVDTFDDFHLLSLGRTVYAGPWSEAVEFFSQNGFACPTYKNPTDYFMTVLKSKDNAKHIADQFDADRLASEREAEHTGDNGDNSGDSTLVSSMKASDVPLWYQTYILWIRFCRTWMRNPILFWSELAQYVIMGLFLGLMYYDVGNDINFGTVDRYASQFVILAAMMIVPAYSALATWDTERKLLNVETNRKSYNLSAYYLAKTASTWPIELLFTLLLCLILYWMIGYQNKVGTFFIFYIAVSLFQLISETIGLICAFATSKSQYAVVALNLAIMLVISFTGFIVRDIPVYFKWIRDASYVSYATAALVRAEFDGITFEHPNGSVIPGEDLLSKDPITDDDLLEATRQDIRVIANGLSVAENCWVLFGMLWGLRLISFVVLIIAKRSRFL